MAHAYAYGALFFSLMSLGVAQTIELESFAQPGAQGAVLPTSSWAPTGNVRRLPDSIVVAGTARDDNGWGASGLKLDARAMNYVTIAAQCDAGNMAGSLVFQLEDAALRTHTVSVPTAQFALGTMTAVQFPLGGWPAAVNFDASQITGWTLGGGTVGLLPFRMSLDSVVLSSAAVVAAPIISLHPADRFIGVGVATTLTVAASGGQLTYRWTRNGSVIGGADGPSLSLANTTLANAGDYQVEVTNGVGTAFSRKASVTVVNLRATQALAPSTTATYEPGTTLTVSTTLAYGDGLGGVGLQVLLPAGWTFVADSGNGAELRPVNGAAGLAEWQWSALPAGSPLTFTYTLAVPSNAKDPQALTAVLQVAQGAVAGLISVTPAPLLIAMGAHPHTADINGDFRLSLLELTRVIELYNTRNGTVRTGAYRVGNGTEDGFTADGERVKGPAASLLPRYHSADYDRDGSLSLDELLRVIQIFNYRAADQVRTGQYRVVPTGTDDGYEPGP